jgi:hypothetical protein
MSGGPPLVRSSLRPFLELRPGASRPLLRVGLWARWTKQAVPGPMAAYYAQPTVLALELPYSVIPFWIRVAGRIDCVARPGSASNVPTWEGIACRWGNAQVWFRNDLFPAGHPDAWTPFSVLALLPDHDPPVRPRVLYLGTQFFTQHTQLEINLRYGNIQFHPTPSGPPHPVAHSDCGEITG